MALKFCDKNKEVLCNCCYKQRFFDYAHALQRSIRIKSYDIYVHYFSYNNHKLYLIGIICLSLINTKRNESTFKLAKTSSFN